MHKYTIIDDLRNETIEVTTEKPLGTHIACFLDEIRQARDVNNDQPKMFEFGGAVYDADDSLYQLFKNMITMYFGSQSGIKVVKCERALNLH